MIGRNAAGIPTRRPASGGRRLGLPTPKPLPAWFGACHRMDGMRHDVSLSCLSHSGVLDRLFSGGSQPKEVWIFAIPQLRGFPNQTDRAWQSQELEFFAFVQSSCEGFCLLDELETWSIFDQPELTEVQKRAMTEEAEKQVLQGCCPWRPASEAKEQTRKVKRVKLKTKFSFFLGLTRIGDTGVGF